MWCRARTTMRCSSCMHSKITSIGTMMGSRTGTSPSLFETSALCGYGYSRLLPDERPFSAQRFKVALRQARQSPKITIRGDRWYRWDSRGSVVPPMTTAYGFVLAMAVKWRSCGQTPCTAPSGAGTETTGTGQGPGGYCPKTHAISPVGTVCQTGHFRELATPHRFPT